MDREGPFHFGGTGLIKSTACIALDAYCGALWIDALIIADPLCSDFYARLLGLPLLQGDGDLRALGHGDRLATHSGAELG